MSTDRHHLERIADIEGTGRQVNERIAAGRRTETERLAEADFRCECGDDTCRETVPIPASDYERLRADSMLFVVRPGHEFPEAEDVVEEADGYEIVRKHENMRPVVERSDPRRGSVG